MTNSTAKFLTDNLLTDNLPTDRHSSTSPHANPSYIPKLQASLPTSDRLFLDTICSNEV
jgi:hypothetical protein